MRYFFIEGEIACLTGLHIGKGGGSIEIGGIDNPIVRNPLTDLPYIPGSSLKGKMRSLLEKDEVDKDEEVAFNRKREGIKRHECDGYDRAKGCPICRLFGSTGEKGENYPARLLVRDGGLSDRDLIMREGMIVTEAKMENTIDRVTSAAVPRTIERVPAGVKFSLNLVYRVDEDKLIDDLQNILLCLRLVEKDGLGGNVSRGYGQVKVHIKRFELENEEGWLLKKREDYSFEDCVNAINKKLKNAS